MKKILLFLSFLLMCVGVWGASATMTGISNATAVTVNGNPGFKCGTGSAGGSMKITVPSGSTSLSFYIGAWKGESPTVSITPTNKISITSLSPPYDNNFTGSGNVFTTNSSESTYYVTITLSNITSSTDIQFSTSSKNKRFIIWKAEYETPSKYTVTFVNELGKNPNSITQLSFGASVDLPTNINVCNKCYIEDWNFYGWVSDRNGHNIFPNIFTPSKDTILYALYSRNGIKDVEVDEYKLVSEDQDDWSGDYLIAFSNTIFADGRVGGQSTGSGGIGEANISVNPGINLSGDTVVLLNYGDLYNITLEKTTDNNGYLLITKDGKYNYYTSRDKNGVDVTANKTTAEEHPLVIDFISPYDIRIKLYGDSYNHVFRYNISGYFRFYKNCGENAIRLYKRQKSHYQSPTEYSTSPECDYQYITNWNTSSINVAAENLEDVTNPAYVTIKNIEQGTTLVNRTGLSASNGEYNVSISNLTNNSCDKINILIEGTDSMYLIYKVPIIVSSNVNTQASIFTGETGCATCDVVVLDNKTLTVSGTTSQNRDVKVYGGGTLSVPSGTTYTINSLALRKTDNASSYLSLYGNLNLSGDSSLFLDIYTDPSDWRWLALPESFQVKNITKSNGKKATFGTDYLIKTYDGNKRSIEKRNGWIMVDEDKIFAPGEGFIFGIAGDGTIKQEYRFKFTNSALDREKANKTLSWETLKAWGCTTEGLAPNHIGWNLIGNPYFTSIGTEIYSPIRIGHLIKDPSGDTWNGKWIVDPDESDARLRYRVVKCAPELSDDGSYRSELLDDIYLEPFECFFVQLGGNNVNPQSITLDVNKRRSIVTRYQVDEDDELFLRVYVDDEKTGWFISDKFTDDYEPGDDFESRRSIYQSINEYKLLYSAIPDSTIIKGIIVYSNGGKITLDPKVDVNEFEQINVFYNNKWYSLLYGETVDVEAGDFLLQAIRKQLDVPTNIDNVKPSEGLYKFTDGKCIYINKNGYIYNTLGTKLK